jgi:tRNA(Arg) A34 adenosine deaminase TadA
MKEFMVQTLALLANNCNKPDLPITSILVNPKTNQILAPAHDTRRSSMHPLHHSIMNLLSSLPALQKPDKAASDEEQYYAQEYDVYTTHEPCTMCAMALVHSRIRRLCFWRGMKTGARELGWMTGSEGEEGLNHRYLVFQGVQGALGDDLEGMVQELGDDVCA